MRKVRGPILDTFYARLRRCGDPACVGRPVTEHSRFPTLTAKPGGRRPVWQQIADTIREAITSGQLAAGEQIPSVRELVVQFGLPVLTLQQAMAELADEGVVAIRQGRRSVVCAHQRRRCHGPLDLLIRAMTAREPDAGSTSAGRCRLGRSGRSTRSCPARSPLRSGGSGSTRTRLPQPGCPRPSPARRPLRRRTLSQR